MTLVSKHVPLDFGAPLKRATIRASYQYEDEGRRQRYAERRAMRLEDVPTWAFRYRRNLTQEKAIEIAHELNGKRKKNPDHFFVAEEFNQRWRVVKLSNV